LSELTFQLATFNAIGAGYSFGYPPPAGAAGAAGAGVAGVGAVIVPASLPTASDCCGRRGVGARQPACRQRLPARFGLKPLASRPACKTRHSDVAARFLQLVHAF
jgi:hypothetical protein